MVRVVRLVRLVVVAGAVVTGIAVTAAVVTAVIRVLGRSSQSIHCRASSAAAKTPSPHQHMHMYMQFHTVKSRAAD